MGIFGGSKGKKKEPVKGIPVSTPASSAPPPPLASGSGILRKPEPRSNEADRDALFSRSGSGVNKQAAKAPASQQHVRFGEVRRVCFLQLRRPVFDREREKCTLAGTIPCLRDAFQPEYGP